MKNYVSPHIHPQSLDSASTPEAFCKKEVELGTGALTVTDHGSLGAAYKVYDLAKKNSLTPVIGCLMPGQEIHTIDGVKSVEDIKVGDLVLTHKGRYRKVNRIMSREYNGNVFTVYIARNGSRGLTVTEEHPIFISNGKGEWKWLTPDKINTGKQLPKTDKKYSKWDNLSDGINRKCVTCNEVKSSDCFHKSKNCSLDNRRSSCKECSKWIHESYIAVPKTKGEGGTLIKTSDYLSPEMKTCCPNFKEEIEITNDFSYFLGLFFAEGSSSPRGGCTMTFNIKETVFADFCVSFIDKTFGVKVGSRVRSNKGTLDLWFYSRPLGALLSGLVGKGARNKKVPKEILTHPSSEIRKNFLRGALDGDGKKDKGKDKGGYIKLSSKSGVWGLKTLIADQGVYSEVKTLNIIFKEKSLTHWSVQISKDVKFRRSIEFDDFVAVPIREIIKSQYVGPVYNFEVEEDNSYVSDFILHNCESYFRDDNCPILTKLGVPKTDTCPRGSDKDKWKLDHPNGSFIDYRKYYHMTLGFQDYDAYLKGVKLLSKADDRAETHGSERKPLFTWDDVEELATTNTTLGSSCLVGMVSAHLANDKSPNSLKLDAARAYFTRLLELFKDRFYIEVFPHRCTHNYIKGVFIDTAGTSFKFHYGKILKTTEGEIRAEELADTWDNKKGLQLLGVKNYSTWQNFDTSLLILNVRKQDGFIQNECCPASPDGDIQYGANRFMMGMAERYNIPVMVSDDSHFTEPSQKIVQDVKLAQMGDWKFANSYHRQSSQESFEFFKTYYGTSEKEFEKWVDNSYNWLEGFKGFKFDNTVQLPTKFYPSDTLAHTRQLIEKHGRMPKNDPKYVERLKKEIDLFHRNGTVDLLPYFFTCEENNRVYENQGYLVGSSRGSAGGVLISYLLGITSIDPIKYNLSLDRFLTLDRIQSKHLPDVDTDFSNRDFLCGKDCEVIEVEAEDGTKHVLPEDFVVDTNQGATPIKQAVEEGLEFDKWW